MHVNGSNGQRDNFSEFQTGTYNLKHQLDALTIELTEI